VYGQEAMVPLEFFVPSLHLAEIRNMIERGSIQERLSELMELEEYNILEGFQQEVQKERGKDWHDKHIKKKRFKKGDLVLLYYNKFLQHPSKFRMNWLGPYEVMYETNGGSMQLKDLTRTKL
jgi:hypothetical protein